MELLIGKGGCTVPKFCCKELRTSIERKIARARWLIYSYKEIRLYPARAKFFCIHSKEWWSHSLLGFALETFPDPTSWTLTTPSCFLKASQLWCSVVWENLGFVEVKPIQLGGLKKKLYSTVIIYLEKQRNYNNFLELDRFIFLSPKDKSRLCLYKSDS